MLNEKGIQNVECQILNVECRRENPEFGEAVLLAAYSLRLAALFHGITFLHPFI
jgi:hypothetical protein